VRIPNVKVCPHHCTPWQFFADVYFERHNVYLLKASRGFGGKSFLISLAGTIQALTRGANISILGGSGEQAQRVLEHMTRHWDYYYARKYLANRKVGEVAREMRFANGAEIKTLMASTTSVRGPHPQKLYLDEADEIDKTGARKRRYPLLDAAMGQPMSSGGVKKGTIIASTHHYAGGTMDELIRRAAQNGWGYYEFCYRENLTHAFVRWEQKRGAWRLVLDGDQPIDGGWLSKDEAESKRSEVTTAMWNAEYENQEPNPESRAVAASAIAEVFRAQLGEYEEGIGKELVFEDPTEGARYATGIDWGKDLHETWIVTLRCDVRPFRLAAVLRLTRQPYHLMAVRANERIRAYGGVGYHDKTGVGNAVDEMLDSRYEPFIFTRSTKSDLLNDYIVGLERHDLIAPYAAVMTTEHRLASWDDVYGANAEGHLPDSMAAMALAYKGAVEYGQMVRLQ